MSTTKEHTRASGTGAAVSIKLNQLFAAVRRRGADEESNADVAAAVSGVLGRPITGSDIAGLRSGIRCDADEWAVLAAVAEHFGMPAAYLDEDDGVGDLAAVQPDLLRLLELVRDLGADSCHL